MSEKEKAPFDKQAADDKVRFEKQTKELETKGWFKMEDGTKSTDPANAHLAKKEKTKSMKDDEPEPLQPKRAMSAYMYFNVECSSEIRAKNPGVVMPMGEVSKAVSDKWGSMTDAQKQPYEDRSAADKKRQEKQLEELNKKGYFTLDDGSKSTDEQNVPKKRKSLKPSNDLSKSMSVDSLKNQKPRLSVKEVKAKVEEAKVARTPKAVAKK